MMGTKGMASPGAATTDYCQAQLDSPWGPLTLVVSRRGLAALQLGPESSKISPGLPEVAEHAEAAAMQGVVEEAARLLADYGAGRRPDFSRLALDIAGTEFQCRVWAAAREIPFGETVSYGELAKRLGRPQGARAVGQALGANRLMIIIPCHRVVARNGSLGGFSGGLDLKWRLLAHERTALGKEPLPRFGPVDQGQHPPVNHASLTLGQTRKLWRPKKHRQS